MSAAVSDRVSPKPDSSEESALIARLSEVVGERHVLTSLPDRIAYSRDCWPKGIILVRGGQVMLHRPACIVQPADAEQTAKVVAICREFAAPIVPYGAGSGVCGGALPDRGGVVVDVKRMTGITDLDPTSLLIRVGAGAIGMDVETELLRRGYTLGHYPSSLYCSSIGGYLAARSAGQQSSRYGKIEDMVQTLRFVTGTGDILDTAPGLGADRWGGGADLTQLIVGSEGTLGVITEATLRIHPKATTREYRGYRCPTIEQGIAAQREIMHAGLRPCVIRLYDEFDTLIAGHGKDEMAKDEAKRKKRSGRKVGLPDRLMAGLYRAANRALPQDVGWMSDAIPNFGAVVSRAAVGLLGRAIGQPLILNQLVDALPGGCLLVIGFEGEEESTRAEARAAWDILDGFGFDLGKGPGEHWLANRFNVSYKQSPMFDAGAFVDTMEVATTWSNILPLYYSVKEAVAEHAFIMAHFSHAYNEGSSIYFTFAGFGSDVDESLANYQATWRAAQDAVIRSGATISHHHGVGLSKAAGVPTDHKGGRPLFEALKRGIDPDGIMNPGKVWAAEEAKG